MNYSVSTSNDYLTYKYMFGERRREGTDGADVGNTGAVGGHTYILMGLICLEYLDTLRNWRYYFLEA